MLIENNHKNSLIFRNELDHNINSIIYFLFFFYTEIKLLH
jgi:hypothetical protein